MKGKSCYSYYSLSYKRLCIGEIVKKFSTLKNYLNNIGLKKEAGYLEYLIKIASEISLSRKIKEEIKRIVIKNSMNITDEESFNSLNENGMIHSIASKFIDILNEQNIDRGEKLTALKWCVLNYLDDNPSLGETIYSEDLMIYINGIMTLYLNKNRIFFDPETYEFDYFDSHNASDIPDLYDGATKLSKLKNFFAKYIYEIGSGDLEEFFESERERSEEKNLETFLGRKERIARVESGKIPVYEDSRFKVILLDNHDACHYGFFASTEWCITQSDDIYWKNYTGFENLMFFIIENMSAKKEDRMRKLAIPYQFGKIYESEMRDKADGEISLSEVKNYLGNKYDAIFSAIEQKVQSVPTLTKSFAKGMRVKRDEFRTLDSERASELFKNIKNKFLLENSDLTEYDIIFYIANLKSKGLFSFKKENIPHIILLFSKAFDRLFTDTDESYHTILNNFEINDKDPLKKEKTAFLTNELLPAAYLKFGNTNLLEDVMNKTGKRQDILRSFNEAEMSLALDHISKELLIIGQNFIKSNNPDQVSEDLITLIDNQTKDFALAKVLSDLQNVTRLYNNLLSMGFSNEQLNYFLREVEFLLEDIENKYGNDHYEFNKDVREAISNVSGERGNLLLLD